MGSHDGSGFVTWGKKCFGDDFGHEALDGACRRKTLLAICLGWMLPSFGTTSAVDFDLGTLAADRTGLDVGHADLKLDGWVSRIVC
ncbi:hypothetical protein ACLOJK_024051 [Asimina triloba]